MAISTRSRRSASSIGALPDDEARFANGFAWPDGKFRFRPNWQGAADRKGYLWTIDPAAMPRMVD